MRPLIKDFVTIVSSSLPIGEPIYEFGAFRVPGHEEYADLRSIFRGKEYVGADMREGPGVDRVLNLHKIDLQSDSAGTVLCLDTLEHVERPFQALEEIHRILRPGGVAVISSVMKFHIHDHPLDYWRFTPEAFRVLLKPFTCSFVGFNGEPDFPHTVVGIGFKNHSPDLADFNKAYELWRVQPEYYMSKWSSFKGKCKLFIPPVCLAFATGLYKILSCNSMRETAVLPASPLSRLKGVKRGRGV